LDESLTEEKLSICSVLQNSKEHELPYLSPYTNPNIRLDPERKSHSLFSQYNIQEMHPSPNRVKQNSNVKTDKD
jgi:hypothetical protein